MIHPRDLPPLLADARDGLLDPERVTALAAEWNQQIHPPFMQFLADHGLLLSQDAADRSTPRNTTPGDRPVIDSQDDGSAMFAGRLDETPTAAASGPGTPRRDGIPDLGERYRLLRLHRGGGLGQVWMGYDTVLGRQVAVKVLREDRMGLPSVDQRFMAEGKAAGRLEHPNIVPVYDLIPPDPATGRDAAYVMRFVAGRTLAEAAHDYHATTPGADPRTALAPLLDAFVLVCRAVAFAHSKGVLHRDIKGANIILGEYGEVQLLDWGLAKPVTTRSAAIGKPVMDPTDAGLTVTGGVVGTPAYVAPEVAHGGNATTASDVYGLGATLYAVLTGKPPADGTTPQAVLETVRRHPPPPPRMVNPTVPAALDTIVRKAMHRDPVQRYATADDLARDVRAWLADEPVIAHRDGLVVRAARWSRRHRTVVVAIGVLLVVGVIALAIADTLLVREQQATAAQWQRAETQLDTTTELLRKVYRVADAGMAAVPESGVARERLYTVAIEAAEQLRGQGDDRHLFDLYRGRAGLRERRLDAGGAMADYEAAAQLPVFDHPAGVLACELWGETERLRAALQLPPVPHPPSSGTAYSKLCQAQAAVLRGRHEEAVGPAELAARRFAVMNAGQWADAEVYRLTTVVLLAKAHRLTGRPSEGLTRLQEVAGLVNGPVRSTIPHDMVHAVAAWRLERGVCLLAAPVPSPEAKQELTAAVAAFDQLLGHYPDSGSMRSRAVEARLTLARLQVGDERKATLKAAHEQARPLRERSEWVAVKAILQQLSEETARP